MTIHRDVYGCPWLLDGESWLCLWTGETKPRWAIHDAEEAPAPTHWQYNRLPDGRGELVLPVAGLRGPLHTIAPAVSRIPDGEYPVEVSVMATSGRPWLRILWGDPDGNDDFGFHVGNTAAQSRGCPLPGLVPTPNGVAESAAAMRIVLAVAAACPGARLRVRTVE